MKVLTLHQPGASLVALGVKTIETRSWSTQYRGLLAIHAGVKAKGCTVGKYGFIPAHASAKAAYLGTTYCLWSEAGWLPAPLGAIVATCTLVDVVPIINRDRTPGAQVDGTYLLRGTGGLGRVVLGLFDASGHGICTTNGNADDHPYTAAHQWRDTTAELPYGDYQTGRYAWLLADVVPVDPPVPFRGGQGLTRSWEPVAA